MNAADVMPALTVAAAVGCALTAGVMFAFSTSVMPALGRNVPMNDHLMTLDPDAAGSVKEWNDYLPRWTCFNHIRVLTGTAGSVALTISALAG